MLLLVYSVGVLSTTLESSTWSRGAYAQLSFSSGAPPSSYSYSFKFASRTFSSSPLNLVNATGTHSLSGTGALGAYDELVIEFGGKSEHPNQGGEIGARESGKKAETDDSMQGENGAEGALPLVHASPMASPPSGRWSVEGRPSRRSAGRSVRRPSNPS